MTRTRADELKQLRSIERNLAVAEMSREAKAPRSRGVLRRVAIFVALLAIGFAVLAYQALVNPEIRFLRPSFDGTWIVHPAAPICQTSVYRRVFNLKEKPARFEIWLTAMREFKATINGVALPSHAGSWKQSQYYDLAPELRVGENTIEMRVTNPLGLVTMLCEGPPEMRSGRDWIACLMNGGAPDVAGVPAADVLWGEQYLHPSTPNAFVGSDACRKWWYAGIWVVLVLAAYALVPARWRPWRRRREPSPEDPIDWDLDAPRAKRQWPTHLAAGVIFAVAAAINLHNATAIHTPGPSADWGGHVAYIKYVAQNWKTPTAKDGWEMFQPPAYYFAAAPFYNWAGGGDAGAHAAQIFTACIGVAQLALAYAFLCFVFPDARTPRLLGFAAVALCPLALYLNPLISNEVFIGLTLPLAAYTILRWGMNDRVKWWQGTLIGFTCALAMMSKYSGLIAPMLLALVWIPRLIVGPHRPWRATIIAGVIIVLGTGWFYLRNYRQFDTPIPGNWLQESGFHYEQHPSVRNVSFYLRGTDVFTFEPIHSMFCSFWGGMYATLWCNAHRYGWLSPKTWDDRARELLLIGGAIPITIAFLLGFAVATLRVLRNGFRQPMTIIVALMMLTLWSLLLYTMRIPFFSTIKAWFGLCLLPAGAVLAGLGLQIMSRNLGKARWAMYAYLIAFFSLAAEVFWYRT